MSEVREKATKAQAALTQLNRLTTEQKIRPCLPWPTH